MVDDLAELVATIVDLPNTAAIAELLVNCRYEHNAVGSAPAVPLRPPG